SIAGQPSPVMARRRAAEREREVRRLVMYASKDGRISAIVRDCSRAPPTRAPKIQARLGGFRLRALREITMSKTAAGSRRATGRGAEAKERVELEGAHLKCVTRRAGPLDTRIDVPSR